jgi:hypothetical protein
MVARETVCLKRLGADRGGEEAAGRFFANPKVTVDKIIESWSQHTRAACRGRHVLAIHDGSKIKFRTRAERRRGLGMVGHGNIHGLMVYAMLAVDADSGACLGLVGGDVWNREGKVTPLRNRALAERESRHWVDAAEQAKTVLAGARSVTVMGDAESDMFPMWATVPEANFHLLIRAQADRRLAGGGTLFAAADAFPVAGRQVIELPARPPDRAARKAKVEIRFGNVEVCRPANEKDRTLAKTVALHLVEVREIDPPANVEPLHWRLLTTHAVNTEADAWRIVSWYRARWIIEQLFRTMKSQGLGLEDSQMASAERLLKLAAVATKAACVIMQLVQERDGTHGLAASVAFDEPEIDTIEMLSPTLEGKTERQKNPHPPRSLAHASWVMARLGGWNCYYKPAGPITMRRGTERFHAIHQGRLLGSRSERDVRLL